MSTHPGHVPDEELNKEADCGCRPGHWCAKHQDQAARDAGKAAQERESARRSKK
jgi:hypothetical protein